MSSKPLTLGLLLSHDDALAAPLATACAAPSFPASMALVLADRPCPAAQKTLPFSPDFETKLTALVKERGVNLLVLWRFTHLFSPAFTEEWRDRLLNCHFSLLPAFKGLHPVRQALAAKVAQTGATFHYVRAPLDEGPILSSLTLPVLKEDTEASLTTRLTEAALPAMIDIIRAIGEGRVNICDEQVFIAP